MRKFFVMVAALLTSAAAFAEDVNVTFSPDSSKLAFTRDNDLWVRDSASGDERRLTSDGSETILNGYASWVYYEEIFGRPSKYRAFWWSPDGRKIAYYRFDNSCVSLFPIFSPFGRDGSLNLTRYPKAGSMNPVVEIYVHDIISGNTVRADFDYSEDQYFGTPFWSDDSSTLYVSREPRRQNMLDLYSVSASDGSKKPVYHEEYPTWVNWIEGMLFGKKGLYMVRDFETGWQQIYYLGYNGRLKRLTEGENWDVTLLRVDEKSGDLWFTARRDSRLHPSLYRLDRKGRVTALTDPRFWVKDVIFSPDGNSFTASISNACTPWKHVKGAACGVPGTVEVVEDTAPRYDLSDRPHPQEIRIENEGFDLYGLVSYPRGFDPSCRYPVLMEVYGGPGTAYVRDRWEDRDASNRWCWENGIIYMVVDPRSSGENGRRGMDQAFRRMTVIELQDYLAWASYMQSLPFVRADRIGVDGFSFGGTTTSMLVMRYPEHFHCGIAGGGVYDWHLYDSHYTERFMDTPQANPEGYDMACVLNYVDSCSLRRDHDGIHGVLKLTHGTGDDNVHFQNTLLLVDALQRNNCAFELMIYPDGMHGYRGFQHVHDMDDAHEFWKRNLLE